MRLRLLGGNVTGEEVVSVADAGREQVLLAGVNARLEPGVNTRYFLIAGSNKASNRYV